MIEIADGLSIGEEEIELSFVHASGPGGQHVNKAATAVQLRFDVRNSPNLSADVRARLSVLAGRRMSQEGVLILVSQRSRSQERNRADAIRRLVALLRQAASVPPRRRRTRTPAASRQRRLRDKRLRSETKRTRRRVSTRDE